ncbi:outer membrane protein assembly factor BamC [Nissabacter sp. SGAir0207]|uniref:outer membrane protein assembly factor BamC n=1 Tax=Nissabacter sp. SGAir0207 TaxID=2126321 RepID=UPI0010CD2B2F|nr:outer membrane protein assembly factor BamC [Nissabacter sp. SGAir0207]QCR35351.1 outer membrane protein assembly factor BamC [Nissabacter sp. SGAir0207]
MVHSLHKSRVAKVVGVSLVLLLAACSSDQRYKRQVSGNEAYLDAPALKELQAPAGMILPLQDGTYDVPAVTLKGGVGKQLDVRPPVQPLPLLNGSRSQVSGDSGTILLENSPQNQNLWSDVVRVVQQNNYGIASRDDGSKTLTTDWVQWNRADEDYQYKGRYQITVAPQGYQLALSVRTLELQQQDKAITSPSDIQRYNGEMLNVLVAGIDKINADLASSRAGRDTSSFNVTSGSDDTGLPVLIIRAPYAQVWDRLPRTLARVGMNVTDSSRPQGTLSVTYKASDSDWDALGAKEPVEVKNGDYKVQLGDLDNRSSLQFIDSKGHPLTQSQNDALVAVFQAAFNQVPAK